MFRTLASHIVSGLLVRLPSRVLLGVAEEMQQQVRRNTSRIDALQRASIKLDRRTVALLELVAKRERRTSPEAAKLRTLPVTWIT